MPDPKLYILTGPIQTGKTSALQKWAGDRKDVSGILTPVINGKRVFLDIASGEQFSMEAGPEETETLAVGRFVFNKKNFEKAGDILAAGSRKNGWLVIDEIGPLELRGEGFNPVLKGIFSYRKENIILVVREGLAENVCSHYGLRSVSLLRPEMLTAIT